MTWNKRTGDAYLRPHNDPKKVWYIDRQLRWCVRPGETVTILSRDTHAKVR